MVLSSKPKIQGRARTDPPRRYVKEWVVVDNGSGENYTLHVNSLDTNGVFERFYWHEAATFDSTAGSCVKTADSTRTRTIGALEVNHGWESWIYGRDDDGLIDGRKFVVFADSAPPAPSLGSHTISGDSVKIVWENADYKDGDSTKFRILFDTNNPPTTVVKSFGICPKEAGLFYFWYHPPVSGRYRFRVIARDARGTQSESPVSSFFDFVKP